MNLSEWARKQVFVTHHAYKPFQAFEGYLRGTRTFAESAVLVMEDLWVELERARNDAYFGGHDIPPEVLAPKPQESAPLLKTEAVAPRPPVPVLPPDKAALLARYRAGEDPEALLREVLGVEGPSGR